MEPPVAVLNESAARTAFDGGDLLGRTIVFDGESREVVGVLADIRHSDLAESTAPEVHVPAAQYLSRDASIAVRTRADPLDVLAAARGTISRLDPGIPLTSIATMSERIERSIAPQLPAVLITATALSALGPAIRASRLDPLATIREE